MLTVPYWAKVHKLLVQYKKQIFIMFIIAYIMGISLVSFGFLLYSFVPSIFNIISGFGGEIGTLALLLFLTTLMPGIFKRFRIFPLLSSSIVLFRRNIGILMFITALVHSFYTYTIPAVMTSSFGPEFLTSREILGSLSLMILFPVWITSNDFSQRKLGKFWKMLQRLTYFALIAIFLHVSFTDLKWAVITLIVFGMEIASWIKVWYFDKKKFLKPQLKYFI